ncbi:VTC domain-containing protein [Spirosomataceae bacterium TFI 002]|nr:VTC domain-containing protein [Spirosomataceae bacterium TFI 002]
MNKYQKQSLAAISEELKELNPISLAQMDSVSLMDRVDVKYVIPIGELPQIIHQINRDFKILEVAEKRVCTYKTLYFDSPELKLYNDHHSGRAGRYKVRLRNYVDSGTSFLEIKEKNNKGRTLKTRISDKGNFNELLSIEQSTFVEKQTPLNPKELRGNLWVNYDRFTLVSLEDNIRVTFDLNLSFSHENRNKQYENIVIVEVKQSKVSDNKLESILRNNGVRSGSISKYCLGRIVTANGIKYNRFKSKFSKINKLQNGVSSKTNS